MALVRAQTTLQMFTGLPEDVATNVTWWDIPLSDLTDPQAQEIVDRLEAAYNSISTYISPVIAPRTASVQLYDMGDTPPRQPYGGPWSFTIGASGSGTGLPNEVAGVVSFHRLITSGVNPARARGRNYLGPLAAAAYTPGSATTMPRLSTAFLTAAGNFAQALATPINGALIINWSQRSTTDGTFAPVVGGWVDNEPDTQRRRGVTASIRTPFTV